MYVYVDMCVICLLGVFIQQWRICGIHPPALSQLDISSVLQHYEFVNPQTIIWKQMKLIIIINFFVVGGGGGGYCNL